MLVDDHGRVFGRFNLLDVVAGIVILALVPLGYAAYLLFRTPAPSLTGIDPPQIQLEREMRLTIRGANLRPYMRVSFDNIQTRTFLFKDETTAEVVFSDVPEGQYDVVLYDYAQERARLPKALTIGPPVLPVTTVHTAGFLTGVKADQAAQFVVGYKFLDSAEILRAGDPSPDVARVEAGAQVVDIPVQATVRIPVLLRVFCSVQTGADGRGECRSVVGPVVGPGVYITLPSSAGRLPFIVTDVQPPVAPTTLEVRLRVAPQDDAIAVTRQGDLDLGRAQNQFAAGAVVRQSPTAASPVMVLSVPAFPSAIGWYYGGQLLRVGSVLSFTSPRYVLNGNVISVQEPQASGTQP